MMDSSRDIEQSKPEDWKMNVLFMTISGMPNYNRHDIYADILHCFADNGHNVYSMSTNQRRNGKPTLLTTEDGIHALRVKTGNITHCRTIEKGISTIMVKRQYISAIKKYFSNIKFDLVLYATPPITLADVVEFVKNRDGAKSYLMLKDIFPQNAVDLGMMTKSGVKGLIYKYFRCEEEKLYSVSDRIGCMSPANVEYLLRNNPSMPKNKVEIFPNCLDPLDLRVSQDIRNELRTKYDIPKDKTVFVYGGNLGKPQGIPFIIESLREASKRTDSFFLIVGGGTEFAKLEALIEQEKPKNVKLMNHIPKEDYDLLVSACDVGLIFLDHRFTIPNFPSRLLSYLQAGLPVLCATDPITDVGEIAKKNGFGWWCESNDVEKFVDLVKSAEIADRKEMGLIGMQFMKKNYHINVGYENLMNFMKYKV